MGGGGAPAGADDGSDAGGRQAGFHAGVGGDGSHTGPGDGAGGGLYAGRDDWPRRRTPGRRPRASLDPTVRIVTIDGATAVEFSAEVVVPDRKRGAVVTAEPYVLLDGGRESEPPAGADVPHVISWRDTATGEIRDGHTLVLSGPDTSRWHITVSQPPDTAVSVRLDVREPTT